MNKYQWIQAGGALAIIIGAIADPSLLGLCILVMLVLIYFQMVIKK